jgi:hypothetical protein
MALGLVAWLGVGLCGLSAVASDPVTVTGEQLDPATYGPGIIETMDDVVARDRAAGPRPSRIGRGDAHGVWIVPSRRATTSPHSGKHYVTNKWGDTRMGIGFPQLVDVHGAYFAGQSEAGVWAAGLRVIGYRAGEVVQETDWFTDIAAKPKWFPMDLRGVDRIVIEAQPVVDGAGWYAMDDLTFSAHSATHVPAGEMTVVNFDDVDYRTVLTGTTYAGLTWETGTGEFGGVRIMPPPRQPPGIREEPAPSGPEQPEPSRAGTAPTLGMNFAGADLGDGNAIPPDSMGAIGPAHYMEVVNQNVSIFDRNTGSRTYNVTLESFFGVSSGTLIGDPRVLFDQHSQRWIVTATTFDDASLRGRIYLGVSKTASPIWGGWFKTYFVAAQGSDAGKWADFPTLGVDANGIYTAAFMVGGNNYMTIFAIDKAPLISSSPYLGTVTAFRNLPWEYAIQPANTYGTPAGEYLLSIYSSSRIRVRRVNPPLTSPSLSEVGLVAISNHTTAPSAPAMGSSTNIDVGDQRLHTTVYRNGYLWTSHTVFWSGRSACRWYQIDPAALMAVQTGTVADDTVYYYYPSLMVNNRGDTVMSFSGSNASQYVATYFTGRLSTDPAGQMAVPVLFKAGEAPYTILDGYGKNRWGDYSHTTLDPNSDLSFWTIQEYAKTGGNKWGTWIAQLTYPPLEEACCYPSGICEDLPSADCLAGGGDPQGAGSTCAGVQCPPCRGDLNCDGKIDFGDINPFVLLLSDPGAWQAAHPGCPMANGDINNSGAAGFDDINPFVALLSGGGLPIPCP